MQGVYYAGKLRNIWQRIIKKFRYCLVEKGGSARKYAGSLMWLYDAGIINFCHNLSIPKLSLEGNAVSDVFKVYMRDTGLLVAMLEEGSAEDIMGGNLGIYKGAVYENIIADILGKKGDPTVWQPMRVQKLLWNIITKSLKKIILFMGIR